MREEKTNNAWEKISKLEILNESGVVQGGPPETASIALLHPKMLTKDEKLTQSESRN